MAEKKRPKAESFFQRKELRVSDEDMKQPKKEAEPLKVRSPTLMQTVMSGMTMGLTGLCCRVSSSCTTRTGGKH